MSIQLTPEQEQRIRTGVNTGAYRSTEEALDAAVAAVETASPDLEVAQGDGTQEELDSLLLEGLNSGDPVEADENFWNRLRAQTDALAAEYRARKPVRER